MRKLPSKIDTGLHHSKMHDTAFYLQILAACRICIPNVAVVLSTSLAPDLKTKTTFKTKPLC